jgi:hypothetical protein
VRSPPERCAVPALATLALALALAATPLEAEPSAVAPPQPPAPAIGRVPSDAQIAAAVKAVASDPLLGGKTKERTLHWTSDRRPSKPGQNAAWIEWIANLFSWLARTSRFLLWGMIALLAAFLAVFLVRLLRERAGPDAADRFTPPTHVRDFDIRPESLPEDIGAAARELWQRGEQRAALALLYRGLISRLVHTHEVPIRSSSTEGECLALAAALLEDSPQRYASRLVRTWQQCVYGGRAPAADSVFALCDEFAGALAARSATAGGPV